MDTKERFFRSFFMASAPPILQTGSYQTFQYDIQPRLFYTGRMPQAEVLPITGQSVQISSCQADAFAHTVSTVYKVGSTGINEDRLFASTPLYAVVDGASSLVNTLYDGQTGAQQAAQCVYDAFYQFHRDQGSRGKFIPLTQAATLANYRLAERMLSYGINCRTAAPEQRLRLWSASAAAVRIHESHAEWMQIGDCKVIFIDKAGNFSMPAADVQHDRQTLVRWKELSERGVKDIRSSLQQEIESVRLQMNRTFGVLNGEQAMGSFLQSGSVALENIEHILIFTDGLSLPSSEPQQGTDYSALCSAYLQKGLLSLHEDIRKKQSQDPECRLFPRFKCHDDTAAIALTRTAQHSG